MFMHGALQFKVNSDYSKLISLYVGNVSGAGTVLKRNHYEAKNIFRFVEQMSTFCRNLKENRQCSSKLK